ncbi:uncharacterized protein LOC132795045 [Drosophila nasuta]|uniref:uncharacterized protein LOC132795045 n=1 Tax=Drosophila nasuta TaxID=42062 RepID=UPI00295F562D|nr:uncharacterized protein LOC132795045 [Drosophila nasuta]XP_060661441.1 uncharacterized protein LOC132795045 [Drosophila nasuta]
MRAGKKTATAADTTGKTRPCIVYVKNLKESETTELINNSTHYSKQQQRNASGKCNINTTTFKEKEKEREKTGDLRETRTSRRATSIANVELLPKRANAAVIGKSPIVASVRGRPPIKQQQLQQQQQLKRRNTEFPVARTPVAAAAATTLAAVKRRDNNNTTITTTTTTSSAKGNKMYKQSKLAMSSSASSAIVTSPPPTIAASRSRRSIKPNPKYASDDMVTPKYVAALASDTPNKRGGGAKQLFLDDDDDEDDDLHDLIEEDNDDELTDAAFNPQLHKSDDDDEISEAEFEEQLRREKVPPKRGRGRPPKHPHAIAAAAAAQAARNAAQAQAEQRGSGGRGNVASVGRGGGTHLQQLRRSMAVNHMVRSNPMTLVGNKRKLEDHQDGPVARKRMATELNSSGGRTAPVINGSTSVAKTAAIGLLGNQSKTKLIVSSNNNSAGGGMRFIQTTNAKQQSQQQQQRAVSNFKLNSASATMPGRPIGSVGVARSGPAARPVAGSQQRGVGSGGGGLKMHKASMGSGAAGNAKVKVDSSSNDEVPTFTIVNIDDIINQDDVLISRTSNNNRKTPHTPRNISSSSNSNNNNSRSTSANNNSSSNSATPLSNNTTGNSLNSSGKRIKMLSTTTTSTAGKTTGGLKQLTLAEATKPRPRILNAEMGKKTPVMKPLMCMGKELCPTPSDGGDTEDDEDLMSHEMADEDDIATISPTTAATTTTTTAAGSGASQSRVVRRVQTAKWLPNAARRNILATTPNASNKQQQQQQQLVTDRKLTKLLGEGSDDDMVFKKPASPSTSLSATNTPQQSALGLRRSKENANANANIIIKTSNSPSNLDEATTIDGDVAAAMLLDGATTTAVAADTKTTGIIKQEAKYFPPETTTYCEEDGRIVKKITCYETWHVISTPRESITKTRQQRTCLELSLAKLANVATRIKVPSSKWTSKVTLYKVSPSLMQRQTMTIFTGDLKTYNIPEEERHKYQPSCVLFRRSVLDRSKCRVPFDRAIIFKNKCFYANIEGKHVNLLGAPEVVNTIKDVEILIDIVDSLALSSNLVEMVTSK